MKKDIYKMIGISGYWIRANQSIFVAFFSLILIAEVLIFPVSSDVRLFGLLAFYWVCARIGKLPGVRVFQVCIVLLGITAFRFLIYGADDMTERFAVWYVLFMALGVLQQWKEG